MSRRLFITILAATAICGCSKEQSYVNPASVTRNSTLHISAAMPLGDTRLSFDEKEVGGITGLASVWTDGDGLAVSYDPSSSDASSVFSLTSGAGSTHGYFTSANAQVTDSRIWSVYYPSTVTNEAMFRDETYLKEQTQKCSGSTEHLKKYFRMKKVHTFDTAQPMPVNISFSGEGFKATSCLKLEISNLPEALEIASISVRIYNYGLVIWSGGFSEITENDEISRTVRFEETKLSKSATAYMVLSSENLSLTDRQYLRVTVRGKDGSEYFTERKSDITKELKSGGYHTISINRGWIDSSIDGVWGSFQEPTVSGITQKYANFIIMGDGYTIEDYAGTPCKFMKDATATYNALFSQEPFRSLKEYFGVYYVNVVSPQKINTIGSYHNGASNVDTHTTLGVKFTPNATTISGDNNKILNIAHSEGGPGPDAVNRSTIIVIANKECHAGTCAIEVSGRSDYSEHHSIAFITLGIPGAGQKDDFVNCVVHEGCGHGFGKLADEYTSNKYYANLPSAQNNLLNCHNSGIYKNVFPYTEGVTKVSDTPWAQFASIATYAPEKIGIYNGAYAVYNGFCRSTEESIMNGQFSGQYFNTISRKQIYHRTMRLVGKSKEEAESGFLSWDKQHLPTGGPYSSTTRGEITYKKDYSHDNLLPYAEPVLHIVD